MHDELNGPAAGVFSLRGPQRDLHGQESSACAEVAVPLASSTGCPCSRGGKTPLGIATSRCKHLRSGREAAPGSCLCWGHALPSPPRGRAASVGFTWAHAWPRDTAWWWDCARVLAMALRACVRAQALASMLSPSPKGKWAPNKVRAGGGGA